MHYYTYSSLEYASFRKNCFVSRVSTKFMHIVNYMGALFSSRAPPVLWAAAACREVGSKSGRQQRATLQQRPLLHSPLAQFPLAIQPIHQ